MKEFEDIRLIDADFGDGAGSRRMFATNVATVKKWNGDSCLKFLYYDLANGQVGVAKLPKLDAYDFLPRIKREDFIAWLDMLTEWNVPEPLKNVFYLQHPEIKAEVCRGKIFEGPASVVLPKETTEDCKKRLYFDEDDF